MATERCAAAEPASVPRNKAEREQTASGLAAKARSGTHAIIATRVLSVLVTAASITILARLIPPAEFGLWAMAGFSLGLMTIFRELGLVPSIVQARDLTLRQQDAYFWTSVAVSLASAALLALAAPLLARFYGEPLLQPVVWACCVALAIAGFGLVHAALLHRSLQYNKLAVMEGGGMLCGLVVSLVCAYLWRDVWALVAGYVSQMAWISSTAWLLCRWVPGPPRRSPASIDLSFSVQVASYNLLTYTANNAGLAAGYRFGAADLAFYHRGQQLYGLANFAVLMPITEVGLALLCRLKSEDAYRNAYMALARRVAVLFIPFATVLPVVSADLIRALLGPAWTPASPILAWFAPAVFGQAFVSVFAQLLTSQARGRELRRWAVADLIGRGGAALFGSQFGLVGMTAGFSLATLLLTFPLMAWIAGRGGPVKLRHQVAAVWPGLLLGAAATAGALGGDLGAQALGLSAGWSRLLFIGGSAALAWAVLCLVLPPARDAVLGKGIARG
jgi:PST family polysaccharide transporter